MYTGPGIEHKDRVNMTGVTVVCKPLGTLGQMTCSVDFLFSRYLLGCTLKENEVSTKQLKWTIQIKCYLLKNTGFYVRDV